MRTWGRVPAQTSIYPASIGTFIIGESALGGQDANNYVWIEVDTDANGNNDAVWLTTLIQVLKLNYGESPIYGDHGIPAYSSVLNQIVPDYYATLAQQQFAQFFVILNLSRQALTASAAPTYDVAITANPGSILHNPVPV
jgi:hypothetical protein